MTEATGRPDNVRRRHVFLIPGHHPAPPRWYRALYAREAARYGIRVMPEGEGWLAEAALDGQPCSATIEVLAWDDLVRRNLNRGLWSVYRAAFRSLGQGLRDGLPWTYARARKAILIPVLYPYLVLFVLPVFSALAGGAVAAVLGLPALAALVLGVATGWGAAWAALRDDWLYVRHLLLAYAWFQDAPGCLPPELDARLAEWTARLQDADADEVLLVGHSVGVPLAVHLAARILRQGAGARLAVLGLGSVTPLVSLIPAARPLRRDLKVLAASGIPWVEIGAPPDGMSFGLACPVAVSGIVEVPDDRPLVISARFSDRLAPARGLARFAYVGLHFRYLRAFYTPGAFDFYAITAGSLSLAARFRDRGSSPSVRRRAAVAYEDAA